MRHWLSQILRAAPVDRAAPQAHLTFGQTSLGRTLSRTGSLFRKQFWIWPVAALILLLAIGYAIRSSVEQTMRDNLSANLQSLLEVERAMLEKWLQVQKSNALTLANSQPIRDLIAQVLAAQESSLPSDPEVPPPLPPASLAKTIAQLERALEPSMSSHDFAGYLVTDRHQKIVAAYTKELIGTTIPSYENFLNRALEGAATVSVPFPSVVMLRDKTGKLRSGVPTLFVCAPVRDNNLQIVAVLALRIRPEQEFTEILQLGRIGQTGETYAINRDGLLVSNSRFDHQLMLLGLLSEDEDSESILKIQVRDPGGNMFEGHRPGVLRKNLPLTEIAAAAIQGTSGVNLDGYRDYRGCPAVGAWTWLPEYQIGLITEMEAAEAFRPLTILRRSFYSLLALLAISAAAIFAFSIAVSRLQRQARKAAIQAKQLGQYRLLDKIGSGAMGVVYKGEHAMLRRPTAIKLLDQDHIDDASIQRFEREVQITCQLNNPHTVNIYDYGRTPEGVFYYAMEYLDGINLQTLVELDGPQPEGRVAHILSQICSSLYEAHTLGLVHRDIKPANVMLNRRGGVADLAKVLDFGLVRAIHDRTQADTSGTPLYMSPEALQTPEAVDPRSDLYAVGAIGYFLLTGQTVFNAKTLSELFRQQIDDPPLSPSQRLGRPVSVELEHAILACLEKNRAKRPQTARDLEAMLDRVPHPWSRDEADTWWSRFERSHTAPQDPTENGDSGNQLPRPSLQSAQTRPSRAAHETRSAAALERTTILPDANDS